MNVIFLGTMQNSTPTTINTLAPMLRTVVPVKTASSFRNRALCLLDMVWTILRSGRKDIVVIHTYSTRAYYYAWFCGLLTRLRGLKYIPYLHGGSLPERMDRNRPWLNSYFTHANMILTPSQYLQTATERRGFGPVTLIPNFIRIADYHWKNRIRLKARLLWVRAFHETYHPEMAVRVLYALRKSEPDACLCMVGPAKDETMGRCKQLALELNVFDHIEFTGGLPKQEWIRRAASYDVFINTTNVDNTPVSVIEAMALGLPVVSTNVGGIPYLLTHGEDARLVPAGDVGAMVQEIRTLLSDAPLAEEQASRARAKVEAFDWEQVKPKWINLIQHLYVA
jgi:L-malate glycosyltransferase